MKKDEEKSVDVHRFVVGVIGGLAQTGCH